MHSRLEANLCQLLPQEHAADAVLSLENRARYQAQHAATEVAKPAPLPPRPAAERLPRFRPVGRFVIHGED